MEKKNINSLAAAAAISKSFNSNEFTSSVDVNGPDNTIVCKVSFPWEGKLRDLPFDDDAVAAHVFMKDLSDGNIKCNFFFHCFGLAFSSIDKDVLADYIEEHNDDDHIRFFVDGSTVAGVLSATTDEDEAVLFCAYTLTHFNVVFCELLEKAFLDLTPSLLDLCEEDDED